MGGEAIVLPTQSAAVSLSRPLFEQRGTSPAARRRRAIFGLLHRAEQHGTTGLIRIGSGAAEVGQLIVARGRVCLAASAEPQPSPDAQTEGDRALALVVRRAQAEGLSLSRCVEDMNDAAIEGLRTTLRVLCARALRRVGDVLAAAGTPPDLHVHPAREDFDARLTSSALDVFLACAAEEQLDDDPVCHAYAALSASGATGLFARLERGSRTAPVLAAGYNLNNVTLRAAVAAVRSAAELCRPWPMVGAGSVAPRCVVLSSDGGTWVCLADGSGLALLRHVDSARTESLISWALSRGACQ
jgi:hypothetical protein